MLKLLCLWAGAGLRAVKAAGSSDALDGSSNGVICSTSRHSMTAAARVASSVIDKKGSRCKQQCRVHYDNHSACRMLLVLALALAGQALLHVPGSRQHLSCSMHTSPASCQHTCRCSACGIPSAAHPCRCITPTSAAVCNHHSHRVVAACTCERDRRSLRQL